MLCAQEPKSISLSVTSKRDIESRAEIAQFVSKFHVAAGGHMVWPGLEPHRIMIDKIIFEFCVVVLILCDYIYIKMPKAKSTWRVQKYFFINGNLKRKL